MMFGRKGGKTIGVTLKAHSQEFPCGAGAAETNPISIHEDKWIGDPALV